MTLSGYWTRVTPGMLKEASDYLDLFKPCCGYECGQCSNDPVRDALAAGITFGMRHMAERIALRIRAELVCCSPEDVVKMRQELETGIRGGFHNICYWGEMAARLAQDPHSQLDSPYRCSRCEEGDECPGPGAPRKRPEEVADASVEA